MTRTVRLGRKGQFVLPKAIRDALGVEEGQEVVATLEGDRVVLRKAADVARQTRGALKGTWGRTARDVARYLEQERASWQR